MGYQRKKKNDATDSLAPQGFTLVEVMLVLGIAGLMLVGLIGGTFASIARQRYNDTMNDFVEYLTRIYSEVASPKSFGSGNSLTEAILGKVLVFGYDYGNADDNRSVFSATLIGNANGGFSDNADFLTEIMSANTDARLFCGNAEQGTSVQQYTPLWQAELKQANDIPDYPGFYTARYDQPFRGTIIIARTPSSSAVHTIYAPGAEFTYNLKYGCTPEDDSANSQTSASGFRYHIEQQRNWPDVNKYYRISDATGICIKSDNSAVSREVRIAADGRNASAIWLRDTDSTDDGGNKCQL